MTGDPVLSALPAIDTARVLPRVFWSHVEGGDFRYLIEASFEDEDPDEVRADLSNAVGHTLWLLGLPETAEACGEATDIILARLPALAAFLDKTSDR